MRNSSVGGSRILQGVFSKAGFSVISQWFSRLVILGLLASFAAFAAEEPDTQYLRVYNLSDQGDSFLAKGQTNQAKAKYQQALNALIELKQDRPNWNTQVVTFRLNDLREKLASFEKRAPAPAPQTQPSKSEAKPQTSSSSGFKLLDAGAEPRKPLRLHVKAGDKQNTSLTVKLSADMQANNVQTQALKLPSIIMDMETVVTNVASNGDITYAVRMTAIRTADDAGSVPGLGDALKSGFSAANGVTTLITLTDRGANKGASFQLPSGSDPKMKQAMDQATEQIKSLSGLSVPFPEEPVGKGARWQFAIPIKAEGINVTPTATFELVSLEGDRYTMKVTLAAQLTNQRIPLSAPPGARIDIAKLNASSTGTISSDLTRLMPASANFDAHIDLQAAMTMGNQKQPMNLRATLGAGLESK